MALTWLEHKILLGSQSPRRAQLLKELGLHFRQIGSHIDESYPGDLNGSEIAEFLAQAKGRSLQNQRRTDEILICSDTVVWIEGKSLEKAQDKLEAQEMLEELSGKSHQVISGVFMSDGEKELLFHDKTIVHFNELKPKTIEHYIEQFKPFDKAGAYGIQEWIGMLGIRSIEGSYFTVMGLPTHLIVEHLQNW